MKYTEEFFSSEVTLPRLVEWFNSQPIEDRQVSPGEFFIVKVKAIMTNSGEPKFLIGNGDTFEDATGDYLGESTFIWVGERGASLVANDDSFFEISKHVPNKMNVRVMSGSLTLPAAPLVPDIVLIAPSGLGDMILPKTQYASYDPDDNKLTVPFGETVTFSPAFDLSTIMSGGQGAVIYGVRSHDIPCGVELIIDGSMIMCDTNSWENYEVYYVNATVPDDKLRGNLISYSFVPDPGLTWSDYPPDYTVTVSYATVFTYG